MPGYVGRTAGHHHRAAAVAAFGTQVDDPVRRADHIEVVFDDDERVTGGQQLAQGAHEARDVLEVQAGGGFIEQQQRTAPGAGGRPGLERVGQEGGNLQSLRLSARQGGNRLTQAQIVEAHIGQRAQGAHDFRVCREQNDSLGYRKLKGVGDGQLPALTLKLHLKHLGTEAPAVAVGTAQIDVGQKLHLDMLEAVAAAGGTTPIARVEAEGAGAVAPLQRQRRLGEQLADRIEGAHHTGGVGARGLADGRLIDQGHVVDPVGTQATIVFAGNRARLAQGAAQGGIEHVLDERGLARAGNAGDGDQAA